MSDAEIFTRLYYFGKVQMGLSDDEFWLMPFGLFMDLWACHKQWLGLEKAHRDVTIDDVIPS
ncbi:hypothetical protein AGMMS50284_5510 [Clostridia bacterium]|nr:hypothetical protein AGMMS50284_5510 [Clostridia bacterium]